MGYWARTPAGGSAAPKQNEEIIFVRFFKSLSALLLGYIVNPTPALNAAGINCLFTHQHTKPAVDKQQSNLLHILGE